MSTVNLYDVLNLQQDCNKQQIKDAYRKLVKEFHPDKEGGDPEMFELITHAYNILIEPTKRSEYDELYELSKHAETDHFVLRDKAKNYYKAQETDIVKKPLDDQKKDFNKEFDYLDKKRGYKRNEDDKALQSKDAIKMWKDLEIAREQDDIENIQEKLFDESQPFALDKFNEAFENMNKGHNELIPHNGNPDAWNSVDMNVGTAYSSVSNYEEIFADDEDVVGSTVFSSVKLNPAKSKKLNKQDVSKLKGVEYTKGHNYKETDYNKSLEERIKERQMESQKLEKREMTDFSTDPSCGGYSIFDKLGIKNAGALTWNDDEEDIKTRYNRLLELRSNKK